MTDQPDSMTYTSLDQAAAGIFGEGTVITKRTPVSGGDINRAYALEFSNGEKLFMKANSLKNADFFRAEAEGLAAIRMTGAVRAPQVIASGTDGSVSFLLLEYIESGPKGKTSSAELGEDLARMHMADTEAFVTGRYTAGAAEFVTDGSFGFAHDNYIGAGFQINTPKKSWTEFFAECRLRPQFDRASSYFNKEDRKRIDAFLDGVDRYLVEPDRPSLLHGDLWAGNYMIDSSGRPWLIDPAAYVGHAEADLAMTELFGGFDRSFYDAYAGTAGIDPGYRDRRDIYNLYHLLNHLNLFGGGYLYSVKAIMDRYFY